MPDELIGAAVSGKQSPIVNEKTQQFRMLDGIQSSYDLKRPEGDAHELGKSWTIVRVRALSREPRSRGRCNIGVEVDRQAAAARRAMLAHIPDSEYAGSVPFRSIPDPKGRSYASECDLPNRSGREWDIDTRLPTARLQNAPMRISAATSSARVRGRCRSGQSPRSIAGAGSGHALLPAAGERHPSRIVRTGVPMQLAAARNLPFVRGVKIDPHDIQILSGSAQFGRRSVRLSMSHASNWLLRCASAGPTFHGCGARRDIMDQRFRRDDAGPRIYLADAFDRRDAPPAPIGASVLPSRPYAYGKHQIARGRPGKERDLVHGRIEAGFHRYVRGACGPPPRQTAQTAARIPAKKCPGRPAIRSGTGPKSPVLFLRAWRISMGSQDVQS